MRSTFELNTEQWPFAVRSLILMFLMWYLGSKIKIAPLTGCSCNAHFLISDFSSISQLVSFSGNQTFMEYLNILAQIIILPVDKAVSLDSSTACGSYREIIIGVP